MGNYFNRVCLYLFPEKKNNDIEYLIKHYTELSDRNKKQSPKRNNAKYNEILKTIQEMEDEDTLFFNDGTYLGDHIR
jgi:hypothetical protein